MKKTSITAIVLLSLFLACEKGANHLSGKRIVNSMPIELAQSIAEKFNPNVYFNTANPDNHYPVISKLDGNNKVKNHTIFYDSHNVPALYAFNYADNQGFVFVSADFQMRPILAFVQQGEFHRDTVPGGLSLWAEKRWIILRSSEMGVLIILNLLNQCGKAIWIRIKFRMLKHNWKLKKGLPL